MYGFGALGAPLNWSNAAGSKSVSRCRGVFDVSGPLGFVADHGEGVVVGSQARSERSCEGFANSFSRYCDDHGDCPNQRECAQTQDKTAAELHIDHGVTSVGDATLWNDTLTLSTSCVFICRQLHDASGRSQAAMFSVWL